MNLLIITGNLTKDAELRYTADEKPVLSFTVANNQGWGDKEHTEYYDCSIWGARGEKLANYLSKGSKVVLHGEHRTKKRENNGKTYFNNDLFVREIDFSSNSVSGGAKPVSSQAENSQSQGGGQSPQPAANDFSDDIPF